MKGIWLKKEDYDSIYVFRAILEHAIDHLGKDEAVIHVKRVFTDDIFDEVIQCVLEQYAKGERMTERMETLDSEIAELLGVRL